MPSYRCTHCREEIEYLYWKGSCTEYGSYYIDSGNYETDDSESGGVNSFSCPNCEAEESNYEDLYEEIEEDEDDENEEQTERTTITDAGNRNIKMGNAMLSGTGIKIFPECGCIAEEQAEKCLTHQN